MSFNLIGKSNKGFGKENKNDGLFPFAGSQSESLS